MRRSLLVVATALFLVTATMPSSANHLSAGYEDAVNSEPREADEDGQRSVSADEYQRGLETDCFDPAGEADVEDVRRSLRENDAFCGQLVYADDFPSIRQESPPDQDLHGPITTFDVTTSREVGETILADCLVFCPDQPGGDAAWNAFHDAGSSVGVTDGPSEADSQENSDRDQVYAARVQVGTASKTVQQNTGAWEMNGWASPAPQRSFVAHLEGPSGPISDADLSGLVSNLKPDTLSEDTAPSICGWTPNADFISTGTQTNCEIEFEYRQPNSPGTTFDGYDDDCKSPAYVCGGVGGPHWTATSSGIVAYGGQEDDDYFVWHWVVAPHPSPCDGFVEPRVGFGTAGADLPFLAHDLDVYTPLQKVNGAPHLSTDGAKAYNNALQDNAISEVNALIEGLSDLVPGLPSEVQDAVNTTTDTATDAVSTANNASFIVDKDNRVEPNNAEPVGSLDDNSQERKLTRTLDDACSIIRNSEDPETLDPWVNYIDAEVAQSAAAASTADPVQPYGDTDRTHDEANAPGPSLFETEGYVGMFADKDDDGEYDQVTESIIPLFGGQQYQADAIQETGAYPSLWDMWVDDNGNIDTTKGCTGIDDTPLAQVMKDAGYGPNTALVQAIYLQEPTVFTEVGSASAAAFPLGNNIYLLGSQSARQLYDPVQEDANPVDERIDDMVADLKTYADATNGDALGAPDVQIPGEELGIRKAFNDQCDEETGGFDGDLQFVHQCETDCSGDTIATMYTFQVASSDGDLGGGDSEIPKLTVDGTSFPSSGNGQYTWYDVDPFDGDTDRNMAQSSAPPTGDN